MKKLLILGLLVLLACNSKSGYKDNKVYATDWDFNQYRGKTISNIRYGKYEGVAGDDLVIRFTDGTTLRVWAYKYTMKIYK